MDWSSQRWDIVIAVVIVIVIVIVIAIVIVLVMFAWNHTSSHPHLQIYGMTENPNNNANYFNPVQGHGNRLPKLAMIITTIVITSMICSF